MPQIELTLNLLRNCRYNPKISARTALHSAFDFNKSPLATLETHLVIHEKTDNHATWSPHGTDGWYIGGPALEHYRCVNCYIPRTHKERIAGETVAYFPSAVAFPKTTTEDYYLRQSVSDILSILDNPSPQLRFSHSVTTQQMQSALLLLF